MKWLVVFTLLIGIKGFCQETFFNIYSTDSSLNRDFSAGGLLINDSLFIVPFNKNFAATNYEYSTNLLILNNEGDPKDTIILFDTVDIYKMLLSSNIIDIPPYIYMEKSSWTLLTKPAIVYLYGFLN